MSDKRRSKREGDREMKKLNSKKLTFGATVITLDATKVVIKTPYRQVIYKAAAANNAYMNWALLFADGDEQERETYANILIGMEMIPVYAHTDPDLAGKIFNIFIDSVNEKINGAAIEDGDDRTADEIISEINDDLKGIVEG